MRKQSSMLFGLPLLILLLFWACNISTPHKKTIFIPPHVHSLYIFTIANESKNRRLPVELRRELRRAFELSGAVSIVPDVRYADAILQSRIKRLFFQAITYAPTGDMDKARYCLEVEFSLKDAVKNRYLMKKQSIMSIKFVNFFTLPVFDRVTVLDSMITNLASKVALFCVKGERDDFNFRYGFEDQPLIEDDGTLIGKEATNYDKNNDGIDDRYQNLTNTTTTQ